MPPLNSPPVAQPEQENKADAPRVQEVPMVDQKLPHAHSKHDQELPQGGTIKKGAMMKSLRKRVGRSDKQRTSKEKRHRRHLVEQHFKIDKENRALLKGVHRYDDDLARDIHDFFNLIMLVPIVLLTILNWDWDALLYKDNFKNNIPFQNCWTGDYFDLFFYTSISYFIIDLAWVVIIPKAVKSPSTIIQHHIATLLYLMIPYKMPSVRFLMGICMSVEINTWFLIARRVFNKQGFPPWTIDLPYLFSVRVKLISIFFYLTWVAIRCIVYPYVLVIMGRLVQDSNLAENNKVMISVAACLHSIFCFLNARWTVDLITGKLRQWRTKSNDLPSGL